MYYNKGTGICSKNIQKSHLLIIVYWDTYVDEAENQVVRDQYT